MIEALFGRIETERRRAAFEQIYDFKTGHGDPERLARAFGRGFKENGEPLTDLIAFARPHIGELKVASYEALGVALALAGLPLQRIERWRSIKALDGGPAIDATHYNESIRGGYSNGVTTYSKSSRFQKLSVWSTFAFTSDDPWVRQMRKGESYGVEEAARLAGISAAHEIGHQLFHFTHPFGQRACVLNPVPMFAYRTWAARLSPKDCPIGSSPAMSPGAYKFFH